MHTSSHSLTDWLRTSQGLVPRWQEGRAWFFTIMLVLSTYHRYNFWCSNEWTMLVLCSFSTLHSCNFSCSRNRRHLKNGIRTNVNQLEFNAQNPNITYVVHGFLCDECENEQHGDESIKRLLVVWVLHWLHSIMGNF